MELLVLETLPSKTCGELSAVNIFAGVPTTVSLAALWGTLAKNANTIELSNPEQRCGIQRAARRDEVAYVDAPLGDNPIVGRGNLLELSHIGETVDVRLIKIDPGLRGVQLS